MTAARHALAPEPFADDTAGFGYFESDIHYQHLAAAICRSIAATPGFVLVTGETAPDGKLLERFLAGGEAGEYRVSPIRCRLGMGLDELMQAFGRQLRLREESEAGSWAVLSQLMQDWRKGVMRILLLQDADSLDDRSLEELHCFTRVDEPHVLPVVLLASASFIERLDAPTLQFLKSAITAHLRLHWLEPEEGVAFINHQLDTAGGDQDVFAPETVASIVEAAQGDPVVFNRLARQAAGLVARSRALMPPPAENVVPLEIEAVSSPGAAEIVDARLQAVPADARILVPSMAPDETLELSAPRRAEPGRRRRYLRPGVAWAGYLMLVATSAAALFYVMAPRSERRPTPHSQPAASGPELARAEAAIAATRLPAAAIPQPSAAANDAPILPEPPAVADEPPLSPGESTASALAAVEPSAAPPPPPAADAPAAALPSVAPERPPVLATVEPEPAPVSPRRVEKSPEDVAMLVRRGRELLATGDIVSARRFFERAAEAGDASAALGLGRSYDPLFLERIRSRGVTGDPPKAAEWYRRAAASGSTEAAALLARLLVRYRL